MFEEVCLVEPSGDKSTLTSKPSSGTSTGQAGATPPPARPSQLGGKRARKMGSTCSPPTTTATATTAGSKRTTSRSRRSSSAGPPGVSATSKPLPVQKNKGKMPLKSSSSGQVFKVPQKKPAAVVRSRKRQSASIVPPPPRKRVQGNASVISTEERRSASHQSSGQTVVADMDSGSATVNQQEMCADILSRDIVSDVTTSTSSMLNSISEPAYSKYPNGIQTLAQSTDAVSVAGSPGHISTVSALNSAAGLGVVNVRAPTPSSQARATLCDGSPPPISAEDMVMVVEESPGTQKVPSDKWTRYDFVQHSSPLI